MTNFIRENWSWLVAPIVVVAVLIAVYAMFLAPEPELICTWGLE